MSRVFSGRASGFCVLSPPQSQLGLITNENNPSP